jgi:hypothetical protein
VRLHELVAFRDHLHGILSDHACEGWRRLDARSKELDMLKRGLPPVSLDDLKDLITDFAKIWESSQERRRAREDARRARPRQPDPPQMTAKEWFENALRHKGRGRPRKIPLSLIASLVADGLTGADLKRRICAETDVDDQTAYDAIGDYKKFSREWMVFAIRMRDDGQLEACMVEPYPLK